MSSENPTTTITMDASERRSVGVVALISMIRMFGLFALLPVLSLYAADLEHQTPLLIGLAVGAYGLTQAGFQIPLGALSDRIGRIPVILIGLGIFAAGSILAAMSESIYGIIAGRFIQGAGAISATLSALITDATRKEVRTRSMAIFGVGIGLSFMLAMVAGPLIAAAFGVRSLFWVAAGLAVIAGALLKLLPDIPAPKKRESWSLLPAMRSDLLRVDSYVFLLHAIMTATFVALPFLLTRRLEMGLTDHWKMYVGALLLSLVISIPEGSPPGARSPDRNGGNHDPGGAAWTDILKFFDRARIPCPRHLFCWLQLPRGRATRQTFDAGRRRRSRRLTGRILERPISGRLHWRPDWRPIPGPGQPK